MSEHILVVDDEPDILNLLSRYLKSEGYDIATAGSGDAMREALNHKIADLVILDLGLPNEDGLSLTRYLRERYDLGIIILTGKNDAIDRVVGLEVGADDYVGKPFLPRELLARIKSVLRRSRERQEEKNSQDSEVYRLGNLTVDLNARRVADPQGETLHLTSTEFDLLCIMLKNRNRPLTRDHLLDNVFGRDWSPYDRSIDVHMANLRRKIERDPKNPEIIKTVRGTGYVLVGPVERLTQRARAS
jgi:DNA-binding response OmpR family regulator